MTQRLSHVADNHGAPKMGLHHRAVRGRASYTYTCRHLDFGLLPSRTARRYISVVLSPQSGMLHYSSPRKVRQGPSSAPALSRWSHLSLAWKAHSGPHLVGPVLPVLQGLTQSLPCRRPLQRAAASDTPSWACVYLKKPQKQPESHTAVMGPQPHGVGP